MTERWISEKRLSTINYLRQLPRDNQQYSEFRKELLKHHKNNKKEFKKFIAEYRTRGFFIAQKARRTAKS